MSKTEQIKKLSQKLKEGRYDIWHEDDCRELLMSIPELEEKQKLKYPEEYIDYVKDIRISFLKNKHFLIDFFGADGLFAHNIGKKKIAFMKDFVVFGLGARSTLFFMDIKNILGKGENAIFRITWDSKDVKSACFLAKDFIELLKIFIYDKKPNDKEVK